MEVRDKYDDELNDDEYIGMTHTDVFGDDFLVKLQYLLKYFSMNSLFPTLIWVFLLLGDEISGSPQNKR